jgi:hypothetical protein
MKPTALPPLTGAWLRASRTEAPAAWQTAVRAALEAACAAGGGIPEAAAALGVSAPVLKRWVQVVPALRAGLALPVRGERGHRGG